MIKQYTTEGKCIVKSIIILFAYRAHPVEKKEKCRSCSIV